MNLTPESYPSNQQLTLFDRSDSPLIFAIINLNLIKQDGILGGCHITLRVDDKLYRQIEVGTLFNLKKELCGALNSVGFQREISIEIEATLQPQLLSELAENGTDSETAIAYLTTCAQQYLAELESGTAEQTLSPHPLLLTESWFALSVKQHLESGEIGYRTFWSYVNPAVLTPEAIADRQFSEAMEQFLKDRNEADLSMVGKAISEAFEEMANGFKDWDETEFLKQTEVAISEIFTEVTKAFENLADPIPAASSSSVSIGRIYQAMINFFSEDDWAFAKLQGELTLRLVFKGKNGQWNCYAKAIETRQQFIFYSISPLEVPETKQLAIAEFLTRANYGMTIGNFELDFEDGEIRYKTSIDVTGSPLTSALIKLIVYINVLTMDQYLPGIQAVIDGVGAIEALRQIEGQVEDPPP